MPPVILKTLTKILTLLKKYQKQLIALACAAAALVVAAGVWFIKTHTITVLSPKGTIAAQQRDLMAIAVLLAVVIVVPVFAMTFWFSWKYRASNTKATYTPDADNNAIAETVWWLVPTAIILILSAVTWRSSHSLDPFKPLAANGNTPVRVQVVALDWKWLFIYPDEHVASVNYFCFPTATPIDFEITADAPMNSFWIPQLGGQVYAMSGMSTQLHLMASETGEYRGVSANISGKGFAGMHFIAEATTQQGYDDWLRNIRLHSDNILTTAEYNRLTKPTENVRPIVYAAVQKNLYTTIVTKYMTHDMGGMGHGAGDSGMPMTVPDIPHSRTTHFDDDPKATPQNLQRTYR